MEIKKDLNTYTLDFWYDLTYGGYLRPTEICENQEDAAKVEKAVEVILDFQKSCEDQIEGFIQ